VELFFECSVWFGYSLECECITHLLQAQINIRSCQYLPALLQLFAAHTKLNTWQSLIITKDVCLCTCVLAHLWFLYGKQTANLS